MADLKSCPFCGRIPVLEDCGENRYFVRCKCGIAQDKLYWQRCDAVRQWNTRKGQGDRMSRLDEDREKLIRLIMSICDYARLGYDISTHNNCNNCYAKNCEYKPDSGGLVVWNCPLWKGEQDAEQGVIESC